MKHKLLKVGALLALFGLLAGAERSHAMGTDNDTLDACLDRAAATFVTCVDEHAWYVAALCELRYSVDALLCVPKQVAGAAT